MDDLYNKPHPTQGCGHHKKPKNTLSPRIGPLASRGHIQGCCPIRLDHTRCRDNHQSIIKNFNPETINNGFRKVRMINASLKGDKSVRSCAQDETEVSDTCSNIRDQL